jgi:hypothetical protein
MVNRLQEYDPSSETLIADEARDLVRRSGMLLFPGWEISSSFFLDQIRRQENAISFEEENPFGVIQGSGFSVDAKTMAIWSLSPGVDKPTLMEIKESPQGNVIFWNVHQASPTQIGTLMQSAVSLGTSKMHVLEDQLHNVYDRYVEAKKNYEEEMKRSYVLEQLNKGLERELKTLVTSARPVTEVIDQGTQTDAVAFSPHVAEPEPEPDLVSEIEKRTLQGMMSHKIDVLKLVSQSVHYTFLNLENAEKQCNESVEILGPLFTQWGPYLQFFDKLVPMLGEKKELPKVTIVSVRKLIGKVRDLNAFFIGKLKNIQNKVKFVADGIPLFFSSIVLSDGAVSDWDSWAQSFDIILKHPKFVSFCNKESEISTVYELMDELYKVETDLNKFVTEGRAITDAKWQKCIDELQGVRTATWPDIDTDIEIWEAVAGVKALPTGGDSD